MSLPTLGRRVSSMSEFLTVGMQNSTDTRRIIFTLAVMNSCIRALAQCLCILYLVLYTPFIVAR
ncbi:hypothetical protein BD311DRAFT_256857 [Dichomitus squalens]|uniref:Uncharacterized protein n=1 Tax=Dichomitus squalens TaxID=114155 RepID=A0A4Q9MRQ1_9APHY|nr:hypothetical protein BD311DRAFT_256857 [Dichomitus squalens]